MSDKKNKKTRPGPKKRLKLRQQAEQENNKPDFLVQSDRFTPPDRKFTPQNHQQYDNRNDMRYHTQNSYNDSRRYSNYNRNTQHYNSIHSRKHNNYGHQSRIVYLDSKQQNVSQNSYKSKINKQDITAQSRLRTTNKKQYKIYELDLAYSLQNQVKTPLPDKVMAIFNTGLDIRQQMNSFDIEEYVNQMSNLQYSELQGKVKALCNKVGDSTRVKIAQKLSELLKIAPTLKTHIVLNIINGVQKLVVSVNSNFKNRYKQLESYAYVCKNTKGLTKEYLQEFILDAFKNKINTLNITSNNDLEDYVRNKSAFINFFVFTLTLHELDHFDMKAVKVLIQDLYSRILTATAGENDTLIAALCTVELQTKAQLVSAREIEVILNTAALSSKKCKFELEALLTRKTK